MVERQIADAIARGELDDLPGSGKPLKALDQPYDENWWAKDLLRREGANVLPHTLELRNEVEKRLARLSRLGSERAVRSAVAELNDYIRESNMTVTSGPASNLTTIDVEELVRRWRHRRAGGDA